MHFFGRSAGIPESRAFRSACLFGQRWWVLTFGMVQAEGVGCVRHARWETSAVWGICLFRFAVVYGFRVDAGSC